jgi:hypothetical protein
MQKLLHIIGQHQLTELPLAAREPTQYLAGYTTTLNHPKVSSVTVLVHFSCYNKIP